MNRHKISAGGSASAYIGDDEDYGDYDDEYDQEALE